MKHLLRSFVLPVLILAAAASCNRISEVAPEPEPKPEEVTIIDVAAPGSIARTTRTSMGAVNEGKRPVYWTEGDRLSLNGTASNELTGVVAEQRSATFTFPGDIATPYNLLYPASFYKDASKITLPASQTYALGTFAPNTSPLAGYATDGSATISMKHLTTTVHLSVKKDAGVSASNLLTVRFRGNAGEQVCGDFTIDYELASLAAAGEGSEVTLNVNQALSESTALELFLVIPAGTYASGFTVVLEDAMHRTMTKVKASSATLEAGKLVKMTEFNFVPSALTTTFDIADIVEEVLPPDGYNITGRVVDNTGNPLENVVVSDGIQCVRTMFDGSFYMISETANVKFVHVSTPSGYKPQVVNGIPKFYKAKTDITPVAGVYDFGDFVLTAMSHPDNVTLLVTADPQPRKNNWTLDKIAYRSLHACADLYEELYDVSRSISGREVYGICLGDIIHEDMSLYAQYNDALATLEYPTYNVIGNHDNNPAAANDDAAAADFESYYGPRNYSFNLSGIHFVVLDNLIMKDNGEGDLTAYDQGLTDGVWAWLQADMAYIPTSTKICVCTHSPMFKQLKGSERTNTAYHAGTRSDKDGGAYGYGDLFDKYSEVHAWAGHTHVGFNYIYPGNHRHKRVQVHNLARSTGELWTNDYLAAGTPRGFTVVEIDNGDIKWKFHPVTRQRGSFQGVSTGYCADGAPAYYWRDWEYNGSGVAVMKNGGGALTEDYQLHAYPRGSYGDNYVYANVFLWDENWDLPVWTPDGGAPVTMTRINTADNHEVIGDVENIYDMADTEFRSWYKVHANKSGGSLAALEGYRIKDTNEADGTLVTIFRAPASASPSSGTVSVTDRFGNTYSRTISW